MEIRGIEQKAGRGWTAIFDLDGDQYNATLGVQKKTSDLNSACAGANIQIVQRNSSDGDDCTYNLRIVGQLQVGASVVGGATCSSGQSELRNAKIYAPSGQVMTDGRIVNIVQTADTLAVRFASIEAGLAMNEDVRSFAQTMADDHKDLGMALDQLAQSGNLKLKPSPYSLMMEKMGAQRRADMVKVLGPRVDRVYVETEITFHRRMLATFDQVLIPNAKSDEVKQLLAQAREVFARHEQHATMTAPILGIPANFSSGRVFYFCQPGSRDSC